MKLGKSNWTELDRELIGTFSDRALLAHQKIHQLVTYLATAVTTFSTKDPARLSFSGPPSGNGKDSDDIEGFTRLAPIFAAWLAGDRPTQIHLNERQMFDCREFIARGIVAGTDPSSPYYWGEVGDHDQRICEAADIALTIWIARKTIWNAFSKREQNNVVRWLTSCRDRNTSDTNWHLFSITIAIALKELTGQSYPAKIDERWTRIKSFHVGEGWFKDGEDGPVDYYTPWGFCYSLYWLNQMDHNFDPEFINNVLVDLRHSLKYFVSAKGFPLMGRSVNYRMAVITPLLTFNPAETDPEEMGIGLRAINAIYSYFIQNGAIHRGCISAGYWEEDLSLINNYSGPASAFWCLRPAIIALTHATESDFWTSEEKLLPIETADFTETIRSIGWTLRGTQADGCIDLEIEANRGNSITKHLPYTLIHEIKDFVRGFPSRPANKAAKYQRPVYHSCKPFFLEP